MVTEPLLRIAETCAQFASTCALIVRNYPCAPRRRYRCVVAYAHPIGARSDAFYTPHEVPIRTNGQTTAWRSIYVMTESLHRLGWPMPYKPNSTPKPSNAASGFRKVTTILPETSSRMIPSQRRIPPFKQDASSSFISAQHHRQDARPLKQSPSNGAYERGSLSYSAPDFPDLQDDLPEVKRQ